MLVKPPNTELYENPSSGSWVVPSGPTGRQTWRS